MRLCSVVLLGACFHPHEEPGAPCSDTDSPCPIEQVCRQGTCYVPSNDTDGDGFNDGWDNCPKVPNPDQLDDDGDGIGDACDPCPVDPADPPSDPDGDGVSDSCDPNPETPGDRIVLFESFHAGLPAGWTATAPTVNLDDAVELRAPGQNHAVMLPPINAPDNGMIMLETVVLSTYGAADADIGPTFPYANASDTGVHCQLYAPTATNPATRYLALYDRIAGVERARDSSMKWKDGTLYRMSLVRSGQMYTCTAVAPDGTTASVSASITGKVMMPAVGYREYSTISDLAWIVIVQSP